MATLGLYFRMSREEANALRKRLNALAAGLGYTASSGPTKGNGNLAALLVGIDKQEITLRKERVMEIKVEFSEDSLMGPADVEEMRLDVKASIASYKEHLIDHLYDKYPNADIEVECSGHDRIQVDGMTDHDEVPWIEQAVNKVWESYQWEVYLPEED